MTNTTDFNFGHHPESWLGGEPRVFAVNAEEEYLYLRNLQGARLLNLAYEGGGLGSLLDSIAEAAGIPWRRSFYKTWATFRIKSRWWFTCVIVIGFSRILGLHLSTS